MRRVFITHAFGGEDERLGSALKEDLEAAGMEGYMAEKTRRYGLLITDKIKRAIDESNWLVAILTKRSRISASVHQEIGYALGKGVKVALMVEDGIEESGVLMHGTEKEVFCLQEFNASARKIVEYIRTSSPPTHDQSSMGEDAKIFLDMRNVLSAKSPTFAQNVHFGSLRSLRSTFFRDAETYPVILFTACPHDLRDYGSVTAPDFVEWAESGPPVKVEGRRIILGASDAKIDINALYLAKRSLQPSIDEYTLSYLEFQNNGFLEYGTSLLFHDVDYKTDSLRLCHMMGSFWGFLVCTRLFYQKLGVNSPYTAILSIRNSSRLTLGNYGDEAVINPNWWHNRRLSFAPGESTTSHANIRLPHTFGPADRVSDAVIAGAVREVAELLCNAYGENRPMCYDDSGRFAWKLWEKVSS